MKMVNVLMAVVPLLALVLAFTTSPAGAAVLFDQTGGRLNASIQDQQFRDFTPQLKQIVADDFSVPAGQTWTIQNVFLTGRFELGPKNMQDVGDNIWNVQIFNDVLSGTNHVPAQTPLFSALLFPSTLNNAPTNGPNFGAINLTLANPAVLNPGTYWISVYPTMKNNTKFFIQLGNLNNLSPIAIFIDQGLTACPAIPRSTWEPASQCQELFVIGPNQGKIATRGGAAVLPTSLVLSLHGFATAISQTTTTGAIIVSTTTGNPVVTATTATTAATTAATTSKIIIV
jgi:hypothetical protein